MPKVSSNLLAEKNLFSIRSSYAFNLNHRYCPGRNSIEIFHGLPKILQENDMKIFRKFGHMYFN